MRGARSLSSSVPAPDVPAGPRSDWRTLARLLPYLWQYKWRVLAALLFVIGAKVANVGVPVLLKNLIDSLDPDQLPPLLWRLLQGVGQRLAQLAREAPARG